jgi:Flp pilus assembly protein TadD
MPASLRLLILCLACLGALLSCVPAAADEVSEVRALIARGDLPGALARADEAAKADPRDAQARFLRGVVLMNMHRDDEAMEVFVQLTQDYPELPDPYNNMALLNVRAGRLELARQALETALRDDPTHREARINLGQVHLMLAVQAWEKAASTGPVDADLQRKLASAKALLAQSPLGAR